MSRTKIENLPENETLCRGEMRKAMGGIGIPNLITAIQRQRKVKFQRDTNIVIWTGPDEGVAGGPPGVPPPEPD